MNMRRISRLPQLLRFQVMMCLSIRNSLSTKQNVLNWIGRQRSKEIQALWIALIIRMHRAHTTSCDDKIYYLFKWLICHVHITIHTNTR